MRVEVAAILLFVATGSGCVDPAPPRSVTPAINENVTAFVNVNVVPMTSRQVLEEYTVLVEDGRITGFGPSYGIPIPTGATRIDGRDKYLMPGLTEMHGHLPNPSMPSEVMENVLFLYVANGVTTVRGMQGHETQFQIRERIRGEGFRDDKLIGPQLLLGSPALSGDTVTSVEQAESLVRDYDDAGFDLLKIHEGLSSDLYDTIAGTARQLGMIFGGHVPDQVGLLRALQVRQTTIDHLDNYVEALVPESQELEEAPGLRGAHELLDRFDESRIELLVRKTRESDVSVVPTMVLWESGIYPTRPSEEILKERNRGRLYAQVDGRSLERGGRRAARRGRSGSDASSRGPAEAAPSGAAHRRRSDPPGNGLPANLQRSRIFRPSRAETLCRSRHDAL